jgi:putative copper export protein
MLAHAHQLTERDSGQFMVLFPILFAAVGLLVWLVQCRSRLLGLHATQYGIILLMVAVVFSTVIIYAPHNTITEPLNETISNAVSSN